MKHQSINAKTTAAHFSIENNHSHRAKRYHSLIESIREQINNCKNDPALIFLADGEKERERLTYAELDARARAFAAFLQAQGLANRSILLMLPPSVEYVVAFLGCLYAGSIAVPAYPALYGLHIDRLLHIAQDCEAHAFLFLKATSASDSIQLRFNRLVAHRSECKFFAMEQLTELSSDGWIEPKVNGETLAFIQYTSGSTGHPRGVMITHDNMLAQFRYFQFAWNNDKQDKAVTWLPMFHDMGILCLFYPMYLGITNVVLPPLAFLQKPLRWLRTISRYRATMSIAPNFAYELCISAVNDCEVPLDLSTWRIAGNGSEPVRADTLKRFADRFSPFGFRYEAHLPGYGLAECTLSVTITPKGKGPFIQKVSVDALRKNKIVFATQQEKYQELVGCGNPDEESTILIVDSDTHQVLENGDIGEVWVASPAVAVGYWNKIDETQRVFNAYTNQGQGPFLRTGDLGAIRENELYITGRKKDLIIIRGQNHYPQDIEQIISRSHEALEPGRSAAFSVEENGEERLIIAQELRRSRIKNFDGEKLIQVIGKALAEEHGIHPYAILLLKPATLHVTSSGKIQRQSCKTEYLEGRFEPLYAWYEKVAANQVESINQEEMSALQLSAFSYEAISTWIQQTIARKKKLPSSKISIDEPFTSFGLDSLELVALSGEISSLLGQELTPTLVYDYPTIRLFAEKIAGTPELKTVTLAPPETNSFLETATHCIAIIGMACRFPGAESVDAYWHLLEAGSDAITEVPADRWDVDDYYDAQWPQPGKMNTRWGGFIDGIADFDASFFGISPLEAESIDPQQRLLLMTVWHALEDAGIPPSTLAGSNTGVFIGVNNVDYHKLQLRDGVGTDAYSGTGNALCVCANRISYFLDLHGPSWAVDTACSSSLVAIHQARTSLLAGECDIAIVGGVNLILSPDVSIMCTHANMLSPEGRCKTFDVSANGYVRSEGCGVVILKRKTEALRDNDRILAEIVGSAVNQDGKSNGLSAPNGIAQQAVIKRALSSANINPEQVSYIEAQGTGTHLGDSIEVNALKAVYDVASKTTSKLWVSTVKTNIGHLEAAAGIAGLIKTVLALRHKCIPRHLHLTQLNSLIKLEGSRLTIPTTQQEWENNEGQLRLAAVSAFGFGGTNAHVILRESQDETSRQPLVKFEQPLTYQLFTISAKSINALQALATNCINFLTNKDTVKISLPALCYTANARRTHHAHRLAFVVQDIEETQKKLQQFLNKDFHNNDFYGLASSSKEKIAFLFPGDISQPRQLTEELYRTHVGFRRILERCDIVFQELLNESLINYIYTNVNQAKASSQLTHLHSALFALQCAFAAVWRSYGIDPSYVAGQGVGELAAACVAEVFSIEDGMRLSIYASQLRKSVSRFGTYFVVSGPRDAMSKLLKLFESQPPPNSRIVAINSVHDIVLSGDAFALQTWLLPWKLENIFFTDVSGKYIDRLQLENEIAVSDFAKVVYQINYSRPVISIISSESGEIVDDQIATPAYWLHHLYTFAQFSLTLTTLNSFNCSTFIELSVDPIFHGLGQEFISNALWLHTLQRDASDSKEFFTNLAQLHLRGCAINWKRGAEFQAMSDVIPPAATAFPGYPFQQQRYWFKAKPELIVPSGLEKPPVNTHLLLGRKLELADVAGRIYFENQFSAYQPLAFSECHILGFSIFPAAAMMELMTVAASEVSIQNSNAWFIEDFIAKNLMIFNGNTISRVQTIIAKSGNQSQVQCYGRDKDDITSVWAEYASASVVLLENIESKPSRIIPKNLFEQWQYLSGDDHYRLLEATGCAVGERYRGLQHVWHSNEELWAWVECPERAEDKSYKLRPAILDACFHAFSVFEMYVKDDSVLLPSSMKRLTAKGNLPRKVWCHIRWHGNIKIDRYKADLALFDESGIELVVIEDLLLNYVSLKTLNENDNSSYENKSQNTNSLSRIIPIANQGHGLLTDIGKLMPEDAKMRILDYLFDLLASVLRLSEMQQSELKPYFQHLRVNEIGLDSLIGVQLRNRILSDLNIDIPIFMFIGGSEAGEITDLIYQQCVLRQLTNTEISDDGETEEFII